MEEILTEKQRETPPPSHPRRVGSAIRGVDVKGLLQKNKGNILTYMSSTALSETTLHPWVKNVLMLSDTFEQHHTAATVA